jgi:hypothetical protein
MGGEDPKTLEISNLVVRDLLTMNRFGEAKRLAATAFEIANRTLAKDDPIRLNLEKSNRLFTGLGLKALRFAGIARRRREVRGV